MNKTTASDWRRFIGEWNDLHLEDLRWVYEDDEEVVLPNSFLNPPATPGAIKDAERRLGCALPPDYKALLRTTNGWSIGDPLDPQSQRLLPIEEVGWFVELLPETAQAWIRPHADISPQETPESIDGEADPCRFTVEHLRASLLISNQSESEVLLLNPLRKTAKGNWEAWLLSPQLPGAARYAGLYRLLKSERSGLERQIEGR